MADISEGSGPFSFDFVFCGDVDGIPTKGVCTLEFRPHQGEYVEMGRHYLRVLKVVHVPSTLSNSVPFTRLILVL